MDVVNNFLSYFSYFTSRPCEPVRTNTVKGGKALVIDTCASL